jgi:hypothetical protein
VSGTRRTTVTVAVSLPCASARRTASVTYRLRERGERVWGPAVELVAEAVGGQAVRLVAVTAGVTEHGVGARVPLVGPPRLGLEVVAGVEEHERLVGRPGVLDAVERDVRARELLRDREGGQIDRLRAKARHPETGWAGAEAVATA